MIVRALRNSNPGNLERGVQWQGLADPHEMSPEQLDEQRFAVFKTPMWGFRALATVLCNYQRLHGLNTIRQIISRWAPPNENNTEAYIKAVSDACHRAPDWPLKLDDAPVLEALAKAIATHECGGWFFEDSALAAGVAAALKS